MIEHILDLLAYGVIPWLAGAVAGSAVVLAQRKRAAASPPYFDPRMGDIIEWKPLGEDILLRGVFDGWAAHAVASDFYVKVDGDVRKIVRLHDRPRVVGHVSAPAAERTVETNGTYREPARRVNSAPSGASTLHKRA